MDAMLQNLDEEAYRNLLARAALEGRPLADLVNEAIRAWLARTEATRPRRRSLRDLQPEPFPEGNERLSDEIDRIVYGSQR